MSSAEQRDLLDDRAFRPVNDDYGGGARDDSHARHQHSDFFSHFEHDGGQEGSHGGIYAQAPADHGGGLGWGPAAWGEAGGFEHVLGGGMAAPQAVGPVDHLAAGDGPSVQTHAANTVNITFDTGPGGILDIGGNVEALGNQSTALNAASSHDSAGVL
uniref:hypothetical protein n=1 Tax=Rhodoblastus sp. TaxID=1962975 RepID=UPI003F9565C8